MSQPLLTGRVAADPNQRIAELEAQVEKLESILRERDAEVAALAKLRRTLEPLYEGLTGFFHASDFAEARRTTGVGGGTGLTPALEMWKQKLGGNFAKAIDALAVGGPMNQQALAVAIGVHRSSVPKIARKLRDAGIITINGGIHALK